MLITDTQTAKNAIFGLMGPQNLSKSFKNLTQKQYFFYHVWVRESKKKIFKQFIMNAV